jgi:hypothetical protein
MHSIEFDHHFTRYKGSLVAYLRDIQAIVYEQRNLVLNDLANKIAQTGHEDVATLLRQIDVTLLDGKALFRKVGREDWES